jgi:hypothetical protein
MGKKSLNPTGALSADQVVEALLDEVDVKTFVAKIAPRMAEALFVLEKRFYGEFRHKRLVNADHADDRAVELVGEVCNDFLIDATGPEFDTLLQRALRLGQNVRPLFT